MWNSLHLEQNHRAPGDVTTAASIGESQNGEYTSSVYLTVMCLEDT